jgi:hypothetical protein
MALNYIKVGDVDGVLEGYNNDDLFTLVSIINTASAKGVNGSFIVAKSDTHWAKDQTGNNITTRDVKSFAKDGYAIARGDISSVDATGTYPTSSNWINNDDLFTLVSLINKYGESKRELNSTTAAGQDSIKFGQATDVWTTAFPHPTDPISITQVTGEAKIKLKFRRSLYSGSGQTYTDVNNPIFKVTDSAGNDIANGSITEAPAFSTETVTNDTIELTLNDALVDGDYKIDFTPTRDGDLLGNSLVFDKILYHSNEEVAAGYFIYGFSKSFSYTKPTSGDTTAPTITSGNTGIDLAENSGAGQTVYTIIANAGDGGTIQSYAIAGDDAALLAVNTLGVVTLTANPTLSKSSYSFTVTATDESATSAETTVTFSITNVDETAPTITSGNTGIDLAENSGAGQTVYTIIANAGDGGTIQSYAIAGDDAALLAVNTLGVVTLTANPNLSKSSYSFTVTATDESATSAETTVTFSITNETAPPPPTTGVTTLTVTEVGGKYVITEGSDSFTRSISLLHKTYEFDFSGINGFQITDGNGTAETSSGSKIAFDVDSSTSTHYFSDRNGSITGGIIYILPPWLGPPS